MDELVSCFIFLYFRLLFYPWEVYLFSKEKQKGSSDRRRGREQVGGIEEGETVIRIYYGRKKSISNKRKKRTKQSKIMIKIFLSKASLMPA